jgi:hypothetical protein
VLPIKNVDLMKNVYNQENVFVHHLSLLIPQMEIFARALVNDLLVA